MLNINIYAPFGNPLVVAFPIFLGYSIIRHRFMDLKIVLRKSSVYLASLLTVIIFALIINYEISEFFPESSFWRDLIIIVFTISTFGPIKMYYYYLANKYFFSSLYDSQTVISELGDKLRTTLELNKIYDFIYIVLVNAFHFKSFGILEYNEKTKEIFLRYNQGFINGRQIKFKSDAFFKKNFMTGGQTILTEEIIRDGGLPEVKKVVSFLESNKIDILTPLIIKNKTVGFIILGPKESGDIYNDEDLLVLKIIGSQAAIAIENAMLYEETKNFNIKLKNEVEKATADLRLANIKLKKLDVAKSEFISIASHQLRTPLTIIKGFISMLLEGDFGKLSEKQKDPMGKVFESNERLINMVENLLNISRIESGRMQFKYEKINVENLLSEVVDDLSSKAAKKELELIYSPSLEDLPEVKIDKEKIRQVIMNLIDNAIVYSRAGKIVVAALRIKNDIQISVADNGIGIKKEDFQNLFKKFSRNSSGLIVNTEGTGLGLYFAKQMVDAHNGKIWAESEGTDRGSIFKLTLPIENSDQSL